MEITELSCRLSGPELVERIQEWRRVASQVISRTVNETSIISVYPSDAEVMTELQRLIEAEKECCSFMDFQIKEEEEHIVVELRVPREMSHVLAMMLELTMPTESVPSRL